MKKILFAALFSVFLSMPSVSQTRYEVPYGAPYFAFNIFDAGEEVVADGNALGKYSLYNLSQNQLNALFDAAKKWSEYINFNPNTLPTFVVYTSGILNASAASPYTPVVGSDYQYTLINSLMNNRTIITPDGSTPEEHGLIEVGVGLIEKYPQWSNYNGPSVIFKDPLPDIYSTMIHEMYHAIGLISGGSKYNEETGDNRYYFSKDAYTPIGIWDSYLRTYSGEISSTSEFNPALVKASQRGMAIRTSASGSEEFNIVDYSPYFSGPETLKVLTGLDNKTVEEMQAYIMSKGGLKNYSSYYAESGVFPQVLGLPVNVIEDNRPELSHIELRNSFMSHQVYQNWAILMEAELAVLKDIGYDVDVRKYFGQSYYLDNLTENFTRGYGANWDEFSKTYSGRSTTENGIGLHIYGSDNNIVQTSDILSDGKYTIGARIDGVGNTYTLESSYKIDTAGDNSIGITVMWGKNHTINLNPTSEVTASGENGVGASFDFGKNVIGGLSYDKGSYSNYNSEFESDIIPLEDTTDALVENFNVAGKLEGKKASIYISENAHVKNINIKNGSSIKGDIISEWNSVKSGENMSVTRFDGSEWIKITGEDPSEIYFTNLNFGDGENPYSGTFSDNIIGSSLYNTIKMTNNGILDFGNPLSTKNIEVYNITNNGTLNLNGNTVLKTQDGMSSINGNGTINVAGGKSLEIFNVLNVENALNLGTGELDASNRTTENITISKLITTDGSKLDIDLGDTFNIADTTGSSGTTEISSIYADTEQVRELEESSVAYSKPIFTDAVADLGDSSTNVYYNSKKYTLGQDATKHNLVVTSISDSNGLSDAVQDPKSANYIVSDGEVQNSDGGAVTGKAFEVSGAEIKFNGNKGLIIDGENNPQGTIIKTSTSGALEGGAYKGTYTVQNGGLLNIISDANNPNVKLSSDNNAIYIDNSSTAQIIAPYGTQVSVTGNIQGEDNTTSKLNVAGGKINIGGVNNITLNTNAKNLNVNNQFTNANVNLAGGEMTFAKDSYLAGGTNTLLLNGGDVNLQNNQISQIDLSKLVLNGQTDLKIDIDIQKGIADTFVFEDENDIVANYGAIKLSDMNFVNVNEKTILKKEEYAVPITAPQFNNTKLGKSFVFDTKPKEILTPIYKYKSVLGPLPDGSVMFVMGKAGNGYHGFNPAVAVAPIASQLGGYLSQLNSYDEAFRNLDMKMLMTREERQAFKMANRYASEVQPQVFSPTYLPEKDSAGWFRPYASFEHVNLKGGPNVENVMYGSYFGGDSQMYETKNGWDYQYSVYVGYNGSHQNYNGNSIYQNGGNLGATGIWYKGDFFTALTANVGASVADASTMYGSEDFPMLMTGVASKTGYNWEFAKGKFIIQPSYLMSYTFVNTFDYTNSAGVRIKSDPLNAINIAPGIKFIGNLKHGWQPYANIQMVWNIMDDTHFKAENISLPNMSVKPYIQYGVGMQKRWGERFTGFVQAMIRNGGRNGIALSGGLRWAIGKDPQKSINYTSKSKTSKTTIKKLGKNTRQII